MSLPVLKFIYEQLFLDFESTEGDLSGKTAVVTGSNSGLGFETSVQLLERGLSRLIMGVRSMDKGQAAKDLMLQRVPGLKRDQIEVWHLAMADYDSVRAFADKCSHELKKIEIVVLNAAVANLEYRVTSDGHEESIQVNTVATGLLAILLLPVLERSKSFNIKPHLVIVGSSMQYWAKLPQQQQADILAAFDDSKTFSRDHYKDTKLLALYIALEISKLPAAQGVLVSSPCPGLCVSSLRRDYPSLLARILDTLAWSTEKGARNIVYAAIAEDYESGAFLFAGKPRAYSTANVTSEHGQVLQKRAWAELKREWQRLDSRTAAIVKA